MRSRAAVLAVLGGLTCFARGVGSTRLLGWGPPAAPPPAATSDAPAPMNFVVPDGGMRLVMPTSDDGEIDDAGPRIIFDPDSITLLPDASLRLAPIADAGAP